MATKDKRSKVLIVAGSAESLMNYQSQLAPYKTETALTAETAIDCIDDFEPDVVIVDEKLPSIPGVDLVHWIRGDQASPHYYAILIVASPKTRDLKELLEQSGADAVCRPEHIRHDLAWRIDVLIKLKNLHDKSSTLVQKLNQSKEAVRELEDQDSITRLFNLSYISTRLEKEFRHAERFELPLSVMIIVINHFRDISHIKGATFCIKMLQQLGNELLQLTRADDIVGRSWGGEFVLILPETKTEGSSNLQQRITSYVSDHLYGVEHDRIALDLSFGVSTFVPRLHVKQNIQQMLLEAEDELIRDQGLKAVKHKVASS